VDASPGLAARLKNQFGVLARRMPDDPQVKEVICTCMFQAMESSSLSFSYKKDL
jgi:hypothetical protein